MRAGRMPFLVVWVLAGCLALGQTQQRPRSDPAWPCVAGRGVGPNYVYIAEATAGQVFLFDPSEIARSHVLMIGRQQHPETIFRASGNLSAVQRSFEFPAIPPGAVPDGTIAGCLLNLLTPVTE